LLQEEPGHEIERPSERLRRYRFEAMTATLKRDSHNDTADADEKEQDRNLEHGRYKCHRPKQEEWHRDDVDEEVRARLMILGVAVPLPPQELIDAHEEREP